MQTARTATVELYWIPLGAGGHYVRFNGRVFEAIEAAYQRRPRCDLYHAALVVELDGDRYTIELAPRMPTRLAEAWSQPARSGVAGPGGCACSATRCDAGQAGRFPISAMRWTDPACSAPILASRAD